jgi:hypothetical protein
MEEAWTATMDTLVIMAMLYCLIMFVVFLVVMRD